MKCKSRPFELFRDATCLSIGTIFILFFSCHALYAAQPETLEDLFALAETPEQAKKHNPPGYLETIKSLSLSPEELNILLTLPYPIKKIAANITREEANALINLNKNPGKVKFACMAPTGTTWAKYIREVPKLVTKRIGNVMRVEAYIGLSLGNDPDYVRKMAAGSLEAAALTTWGLKTISKEIGVYELPFLFDTYGEADYVIGKTWNRFMGGFEKKGFTLVSTPFEVGFLQIYSTRKIVRLPKDLSGSKYGSWMGDVEIATLRQLNINPVVFTALELPGSLASGIIETQSAPTMYMVGAQILNFIQKRGGCSVVNIFYPPAGLVYHRENVVKAMLANVSAKDRTFLTKYADGVTLLFDELLSEISPMLAKELRQANRRLIDNFETNGLNVYTPTTEERQVWKEAVRPVWHNLAGKIYTQESLDVILKHKSDYRAAHPDKFKRYELIAERVENN